MQSAFREIGAVSVRRLKLDRPLHSSRFSAPSSGKSRVESRESRISRLGLTPFWRVQEKRCQHASWPSKREKSGSRTQRKAVSGVEVLAPSRILHSSRVVKLGPPFFRRDGGWSSDTLCGLSISLCSSGTLRSIRMCTWWFH